MHLKGEGMNEALDYLVHKMIETQTAGFFFVLLVSDNFLTTTKPNLPRV